MRRFALPILLALACASGEPDRERSVEPEPAAAAAHASVARVATPEEHTATERTPEIEAEIDPRFTDMLVAVASAYRGWKTVDDELRFAPQLCRLPMPGGLRFSESGDASTHGSKLYLIYAKDPVAYGWPPTVGGTGGTTLGEPAPSIPAEIQQAIVKESFAALAHDPQGRPPPGIDADPLSRRRPASRDGTLFSAGEPLGLYVMVKLAAETPGTDQGWVYGTLSPDGTLVTSAGRVKSCMACHETAPGDRLFGRKTAGAEPRPHANAAPR